MLNNVILLLGSNINYPEKNIDNSINLIEEKLGKILAKSNKKRTKPVEFESDNFFCNISVLISTEFSPTKLLENIKKIEQQMGRIEDSSAKKYYEDRIIDIDIVKFGNLEFRSKKLEIPHKKHLYKRDFSIELINEVENIYKNI